MGERYPRLSWRSGSNGKRVRGGRNRRPFLPQQRGSGACRPRGLRSGGRIPRETDASAHHSHPPPFVVLPGETPATAGTPAVPLAPAWVGSRFSVKIQVRDLRPGPSAPAAALRPRRRLYLMLFVCLRHGCRPLICSSPGWDFFDFRTYQPCYISRIDSIASADVGLPFPAWVRIPVTEPRSLRP